MPKIQYVKKRFNASSLTVIDQCQQIISDYQRQGFTLTLRQLYYQMVSKDFIPNNVKSYKRVGSIISDARVAGLIDWYAIEDRTRGLRGLSYFDAPSDVIDAAAYSFRLDKWASQNFQVQVWIEKDALAGVFSRVCNELEVPYLSCRGYTSQSTMWSNAQGLLRTERNAKQNVILHFGDMDPSGLDMSRDIEDRLSMFGTSPIIHRIALNRDQVDKYNPPPNPAKEVDPRFKDYQREHGDESWELDALEPSVLSELVRKFTLKYRDQEAWNKVEVEQEEKRRVLKQAAARWDEVVEFLEVA